MSATARASGPRAHEIYERLFREGRESVIASMSRKFRDRTREDIEDAVSRTMLELVREARLTHWDPGAIALWHERTYLRLLDDVKAEAALRAGGAGRGATGADARRRRVSHEELSPRHAAAVADPSADAGAAVETAFSNWRAIELMAQMSPRAATYTRLALLEGGRRRDVMAATGWSEMQFKRAQQEAKAALRAALADLHHDDGCERFRTLVDSVAVGEAIGSRSRILVAAHQRRCAACRAYAGEAQRTVRAVIPVLGLIVPTATLSGGVGVVAVGGSSAGLAAGVGGGSVIGGGLMKGAAAVCATVCVAAAAVELPRRVGTHDTQQSPKTESRSASFPAPAGAPPAALRAPAVVGQLTPARQERTAAEPGAGVAPGVAADNDPFGLSSGSRPARSTRRPSAGEREQDALGLGAIPRARRRPSAARPNAQPSAPAAAAAAPAAPAPQAPVAPPTAATTAAPRDHTVAPEPTTSCTPGELGC